MSSHNEETREREPQRLSWAARSRRDNPEQWLPPTLEELRNGLKQLRGMSHQEFMERERKSIASREACRL
jgi:hypothetical protein